MKSAAFAPVLALALALAGCAGMKPQAPAGATAEQRISGKLSVQVQEAQDPDARKGGSGSFELLGNARAGQFELSTPLGGLVARANWGAGEVMLATPQGSRSFADLDALSREMLGETIPVAALFDWLQGRAWAGAPSKALGDGFEQLGWRIDLSRFPDSILTATRSYAPVVTLRARIDANP